MSVKIIIKDCKYIPFLNTVGPILTPVRVPREIYNRLVSGGLKVELFEGHMSTVAKAKEVVKVKEVAKEEKINFNDIAAKPIQEEIVVEAKEEVVEEIVEEVEYEEVEVEEIEYVEEVVEEEVVEEPQPKAAGKKKKK